MFDEWQQRRKERRIKEGDGRPLPRFRWWQQLFRSLFHLRLVDEDGREVDYAVDVRHGGDQETGIVWAHLYVDDRLTLESKLPAAFPVPGGVIEVARSELGLKRCHYVRADGAERQLTPEPRSAEGRRLRLEENHPGLSRGIAVVAVAVLVVGVVLLALQVAEPIAQIPPIAERWGTWESPVDLPWWLNTGVGVVTVLAGVERALRLRYHWLLDGAAG